MNWRDAPVAASATAKPVTDYATISCGCAETPVAVGSAPVGSALSSTATPKSHNADAFVQMARFGGR